MQKKLTISYQQTYKNNAIMNKKYPIESAAKFVAALIVMQTPQITCFDDVVKKTGNFKSAWMRAVSVCINTIAFGMAHYIAYQLNYGYLHKISCRVNWWLDNTTLTCNQYYLALSPCVVLRGQSSDVYEPTAMTELYK